MIRSISIENLRGIRSGKLDDFTPIVVLVGPNSCGKSTVLDALLLGASPNFEKALDNVVNRRSNQKEGGADWLLYRQGAMEGENASIALGGNPTETREVMVCRDKNGNLVLVRKPQIKRFKIAGVEVHEQAPYSERGTWAPTRYVYLVEPYGGDPQQNGGSLKQTIFDVFASVSARGLKDQVMGIVRELDPQIKGLEIQAPQGKPVFYLTYSSGALPLWTAGEGVQLLIRQSLELASEPGSVVLLEEPETHMHPRAIAQSARAIFAAMRRDIQIFLTTHSLELIDALLYEAQQAKPEELDKLSVFGMRLQDGDLKSVRYSGKDAAFSRSQIEDDLR